MRHKNIILPIAICAFGTLSVTPIYAQTKKIDPVKLEEAVFLQDIKLDYAAAAKIYLSILEESKKSNLETTYRLSQCQKHLGQQNEYKHTLDQLSKYKDKTNKWVKLAIQEKKLVLKFAKPIWEDGDALSYNIILPDGSKKNYFTIIYDKMADQKSWKINTLRCHIDDSRSEVTFDETNYRPLSSHWVYINTGGGYHTIYDTKTTWDSKSFDNDLISSLARVLPMDTVKRPYEISVSGRTWPVLIYRTKDKRTITTAAGEFECSKVVCEVNVKKGIAIEMWINTKGKRELIELTQPGLKIQLSEIGTRKNLQSKITKITAFPLMHHSKSGLHQVTANNDDVYRSMLFPATGIYLARLEINHTKNLLQSLRNDPVALATHLENNIRKQEKIAQFKLPKNAEHLTLAGCKGILYTSPGLAIEGDGSDQFVCFYGVSQQTSIFLRGCYTKGKEQAAKEELKRILTEDLKLFK